MRLASESFYYVHSHYGWWRICYDAVLVVEVDEEESDK